MFLVSCFALAGGIRRQKRRYFRNLIKISHKLMFFNLFFCFWNGIHRATFWTITNFLSVISISIIHQRYIFYDFFFVQVIPQRWEQKCLKTSCFMLKLRRWREKVNFLVLYIKNCRYLKQNKNYDKLHRYIRTQVTNNNSKLIVYIYTSRPY